MLCRYWGYRGFVCGDMASCNVVCGSVGSPLDGPRCTPRSHGCVCAHTDSVRELMSGSVLMLSLPQPCRVHTRFRVGLESGSSGAIVQTV